MAFQEESGQQSRKKFLESLQKLLVSRGIPTEQSRSITDPYAPRGIWSAVDIEVLPHTNLQFMTLAFYVVVSYNLQTSHAIQTFFRQSSGQWQMLYDLLDKAFKLGGKPNDFAMLNLQTLLSYCELTLPTTRNIA